MTRLSQLILHSFFLGVCAVLLGNLIAFDQNTSLFILLSTTLGYVYLRRNHLSVEQRKGALITAVLLAIPTAISFFYLPLQAKAIAIFSAALTMLYAQENNFSLRKYVLIKPLAIAACWTLNTIIISYPDPLFFIPNDHSVLIHVVHVFLLTFILSLLYDLRDFKNGLDDTVVFFNYFGEKNTRLIIVTILNISLVTSILISSSLSASIALFGASLYTVFLLYWGKPNRELMYTWLVDSAFIIYALLAMVVY